MLKNVVSTVILCVASIPTQAMEDHGTRDPYLYRDENTIRDRREIAVLSYGSLVNDPAPDNRPALKAGQFSRSNITLPVALSRQSQGNRITAVIDNTLGTDKTMYYATSKFHFLPNARNNLAGREGVPFRSGQYSLDNIFYMKKGGTRDSNETPISGSHNWVMRASDSRVVLSNDKSLEIAKWADQKGYTAVIWASFPPNKSSIREVARNLLSDTELLRNTKNYVDLLPDGPQTDLERAISRQDRPTLQRLANS